MQSAIRQNIFWTAVTDIILTGERARIWCGVASVFFPARSLPLTREAWGLQMPSLAAGSQGTRGKLVNVSQVSAHACLELLPCVTCSTALNGFLHPHLPRPGRRMQRNSPIPAAYQVPEALIICSNKHTVSRIEAVIGVIA